MAVPRTLRPVRPIEILGADHSPAGAVHEPQELELAALEAADRRLKAIGYIALDEVFREMGKLEAKHWEDWRFGRVPHLERVIRLNLSQINAVCRAVHASARRGNLKSSWTACVKWGNGARTPLPFTKSGDPRLERAWSTRYLLPKPAPVRANATPSPESPPPAPVDLRAARDAGGATAAAPGGGPSQIEL